MPSVAEAASSPPQDPVGYPRRVDDGFHRNAGVMDAQMDVRHYLPVCARCRRWIRVKREGFGLEKALAAILVAGSRTLPVVSWAIALIQGIDARQGKVEGAGCPLPRTPDHYGHCGALALRWKGAPSCRCTAWVPYSWHFSGCGLDYSQPFRV